MSRERSGRAHPQRRRRVAMGLVVCGLVSSVAGWFAGTQVISSAEAQANRRPPDATVLTAQVEHRALHSYAITRGTMTRNTEYSLTVAPPTSPDVGAIITATSASVGQTLHEGDHATEVGGRPVIALQGSLPAFRDLRLYDEGIDVNQLRSSLARLGFLDSGEPGPFDYHVEAAVKRLYASSGYQAPDGDGQAQLALRGAEAAYRAATAALEALACRCRAVSDAERLAAESAVAAAENQLAIIDAETFAAVDRAQRGLDSAAEAVGRARDAVGVAEDRLVQAENGRHPDTGEPPTTSQLTQLRADLDAAEDTLAEAEDVLAERQHELEIAQLQRTAELAAAEAAVELATTQLQQLGTVPAPSAAEREAAQLALAEAEDALRAAQRMAAAYVPQSEVVYIPTMPAQVTQTLLGPGDSLDGPFAVVAGQELRIEAPVLSSVISSINAGDIATLDDAAAGVEFEATVVEVASTPATTGPDAGKFMLTLVPVSQPPDHAVGLSLRIRIPIESTGTAELIVPVTALSTAPDGSVFVERVTAAGVEKVSVRVTLSASGFAAVSPQPGHTLSPGDEVIVGLGTG